MADILKVHSSALSHPGQKRANNEDYFAYFEPTDPELLKSRGCLYVVADGVGGAAEGERASQYAAQTVLHEYFQHPERTPEESLIQSIKQASQEIYTYAEDGFRRMATTLVAAVVLGDLLIVANVGDSRAYLIRDGEASQISIDHNTVEEMVQNGLLSEEEAINFKAKNVLTRAIGSEYDVDVDIFSDIQLQSGDKILLCTDGLTRYATLQTIADLTAQGQVDEIATKLIDYANQQGGKDNTSVIMIEIGKPEDFGAVVDRPHRSLPPEVDWDSITTQAVSIKRRGLKRNRTKLKVATVPLVVGSLALLTVLFFVGFAIRKIQTPQLTNTLESQTTLSVIDTSVNKLTNTPTTSMESAFTTQFSPTSEIETSTSIQEPPTTLEVATSTSIPEITRTEETTTPTNSVLIKETHWCVYIVKDKGPRTILEIIKMFAIDSNLDELVDQLFEATGGQPWEKVWPNGKNEYLDRDSRVALAFVKTVQECEDHDGEVWQRP